MLLLTALSTAVPQPAYAGLITVKPGKFDHFDISVPEKIIAGEESLIRLDAADVFNNRLTNFEETAREFQVSVSGSAVAGPVVLESSFFVNGAFHLSIMDNVAETVNLSIWETVSPVKVLSKEIRIMPNKLNSFAIKGPQLVQAGRRFDIIISARDAFGNTVTDPIPGKNIDLIFIGEAEPKVDMPSIPDFKNGIGNISLLSLKSGTFIIEAKDITNDSSGTSEKMEVSNGPLHSFKIFAPKEVFAGEPFEASIVAVDNFDNPVLNYSGTRNNIVITARGKSSSFSTPIPAYKFINGQVKAELRYDAAESFSIAVADTNKKFSGHSDIIKVIAPVLTTLEVKTPETAVAGQKFKIKLTAYDQVGRLIKNYRLTGADIQLASTGTGILVPENIPAAEFRDGTAVVEAQYNKSESFTIIASPVTTEQKRVSLKSLKTTASPKTKKIKKITRVRNESRPFEIMDISVTEPQEKSVVTAQIPNLDETVGYKVSNETIDGKKWIILRVKPAINKMGKSFKPSSAYVGNVVVEEDVKEKKTVLIKIEQLKPARFYVTSEKDSLLVTLKH